MLLGAELQGGELVGPHRGGAYVAYFSAEDEVVQRAHGFGGGHGGVEAVDLEQVDVVCSQACEGGVDGVEEGGAGEACELSVGLVIGDEWQGERERGKKRG